MIKITENQISTVDEFYEANGIAALKIQISIQNVCRLPHRIKIIDPKSLKSGFI
jgi:hypothetical protein